MPAEQLSGTIVVIIIAIGVQGCIMLTIFAKRQVDNRLNPADLETRHQVTSDHL